MQAIVFKTSKSTKTSHGIFRDMEVLKETPKTIKVRAMRGPMERTILKRDVIFMGDVNQAETIYQTWGTQK